MAALLVVLAVLLQCALVAAHHRKLLSKIPSRPNIVFLLADDLGYGDVHYNGGQADTPTLDTMATGESSVLFSRFYSSAPVCSPTRGSILTGRNHNRFCVWRSNTHGRECEFVNDLHCPSKVPLPPSEVTVAEVLQNIGYQTAAIGKWHLGDLVPMSHGHPQWSPSHPGMHGFDVWKVTERAVPTVNPNCACFDTDTCLLSHYSRQSPPPCYNYHGNAVIDAWDFSSNTSTSSSSSSSHFAEVTGDTSSITSIPTQSVVSHPTPILGDDSDFIAQELSSFMIDSVTDNKPFFAYVAFHTPHNRYIAPSGYAEKYHERGWRRKQKDYYGAIEALDFAVSQILQQLDQLNITNNTMVWFTSDNGPAPKSPGVTGGLRGLKGSLFEGGIRVPGILKWPGVIKQNIRTDYPVTTSDFLPTVLDVVKTELPDSRPLDGSSVVPLLVGQRMSRPNPLHWAFKLNGNFSSKFRAVSMDGDLKLHALYRDGEVHNTWLYNLTQGEMHSIAHTIPGQHRRMLRELNSWTRSLATSAEQEVQCVTSTGYFDP